MKDTMLLKQRFSVCAARAAALAVLGALLACTPSPQAGNIGAPASASLIVKVSGVANAKGKILAALCSKDSFLKECAHTAMAPASAVAELRFEQLPPGAYAVMVFHDENDNLLFDKSASGIPLEGYGFSRNARGKYGPPAFDDARIELKAGTETIAIELAY